MDRKLENYFTIKELNFNKCSIFHLKSIKYENSEDKSIKILVLHGFFQNANKMISLITPYLLKLEFNADVLIPDAPMYLLKDKPFYKNWTYWDLEGKSENDNFKKEYKTYINFENCANYLFDLLNFLKYNVDYFMGFSQGALISCFLTVLINFDKKVCSFFDNFKGLILFSPFINPYPDNKELKEYFDKIKHLINTNNDNYENQIDKKALIIYGDQDNYILPEMSINCSKIFKTSIVFNHDKGHIIPSDVKNIENIASLINQLII